MLSKNKTVRYYYWLITAFARKNARVILLSFGVSILVVVGLVSIFPYVIQYTTTERKIIGFAGSYDLNSIPDEITSQISNGLLQPNEKGVMQPVLAERYELSSDGKTYRVYLKKDIFWNNGDPFTAYDIPYEFQDVQTKVVDDHQIEFTLKNPLPIFPTYLSKPIIKQPVVGVSGLYTVDRTKIKFDQIDEISLRPNKSGLPAYTYKFYEDETHLVNAYKLGEISEFRTTKRSVADLFRVWNNTEVSNGVDYRLLLTLFINMKKEMLGQSKDLREAIAMAIDRSEFEAEGVEAVGPIPPISWGYNNNLKPIPRNADLAKRIISGIKDASHAAELEISTSYEYTDIAEAIKADLQEVGFKVRIKSLGYGDLGDYDVLLAYWNIPYDPDQYYFWHSTQKQGNVTNYQNVKIDKLLEDGRNRANISERKEIYAQFQRVLQDDVPAVFLYYPYTYTITRK